VGTDIPATKKDVAKAATCNLNTSSTIPMETERPKYTENEQQNIEIVTISVCVFKETPPVGFQKFLNLIIYKTCEYSIHSLISLR